MSRTDSETRSDLRSVYGLACPQCRQADAVSVEIVCTANLTINGTEACGDHYWDDTSSCHCDECDHHGTVGEFRITSDKAVQP